MRVIANFLFLSSITLLFFTHHALARLHDGAHIEVRFSHDERRTPPAFRHNDTPSQPPQQVTRVGMPSNRSLKLTVTGKPQTDERKAFQDAIREAREQLVARLRELKPDLKWDGPKSSEIDHLVVSKKTESEYFKLPIDAVMYTTKLELEVTPSDQANLLRHVRLEEAGARQFFLLKPLLAALGVLLTIAGYYRLEDMTKGYYTLLLRASAVVLIGALGFSIFLWI